MIQTLRDSVPEKQAGVPLCVTLVLVCWGPGTGVLSEKQLFLAVPEKGVLAACTEHPRGLSGEGMGGPSERRGARIGGMGPCEDWCQLSVLAWKREQRWPLEAEGSKEAVGFLHVSRLCGVPCEAWRSPQRQPGLQGLCRPAERINGFPQPSTITKSLWRHQ